MTFERNGQAQIMHILHPLGLRVTGEIDRSNRRVLARALRWATRIDDQDIRLDLGGLSFIDAAGLRLILATAAGLRPGRELILDPAPPAVRELLARLGWGLTAGQRLYVPQASRQDPAQ
ncbi:STAS domain-containing protein [Nonomuraea sp. LPB2021202275-12-8]|uniref:STAS domain-containing protein n=1 Tax=Nonomuraea sp. LPB2021202275-12-8 TaxID=3120159 RepID=UPI00300D672B